MSNRYFVNGAWTGAQPDSDAERIIKSKLEDMATFDLSGSEAEQLETSLRTVYQSAERATVQKCAAVECRECEQGHPSRQYGTTAWVVHFSTITNEDSQVFCAAQKIRAAFPQHFTPDPTQEAAEQSATTETE